MLTIVGSGMAGLLAANALRRLSPVVHEAQAALPNNHSSLLRFRSDACQKTTGIPFRRVMVNKAIVHDSELHCQTSLAFNNMYSQKVTGKISGRSILNLETSERWIAPDDFVQQMAASVNVQFGKRFTAVELSERSPDSSPLLSTLPMPALMDLCEWPNKPKFEWRTTWSVRCKIPNCDVYQTLYYPSHNVDYYRASITGDTLIVECLSKPEGEEPAFIFTILRDFGIRCSFPKCEVKEQKYGKLRPPDDAHELRRFIVAMTDRYRIYSLGRFAIWRNILLDDVCRDISVIERLIESRDGYRIPQAR